MYSDGILMWDRNTYIHTYIHFVSFNPDLPLSYGYETCQNLGRTQTNITYRIPTYI